MAEEEWVEWRGEKQPPAFVLKRERDTFNADPSMVDPAAKLAVEFREECGHDEPARADDGGERRVLIPPYRECERESSPARGGSFELGRQYIRSSSLVTRLIERRDENPVAVDYDLDSEDDELLDRVNGVGDSVGGAGASKCEVLPADALEAAMRSLEVESFGVMMHHVEVPTCKAYLDASLPGVFPLRYNHAPLNNSSPVSGPPSPKDSGEKEPLAREEPLAHAIKLFAAPPSSRRNASRDTLQRSSASNSKGERRLRVPGARPDAEAGKDGEGRVREAGRKASCTPALRVPQHVRNRQLERKRAAQGQVDGAGERLAASTAGGLGRREGCTRGGAECVRSVAEGTSAGLLTIQGADAHAAHWSAGVGSEPGLLESTATCTARRLARSPPRKLSEAEELGVCAVCLNDGADEGNLIILCDACGIAVHQICYGICEIPDPGDKWFCAPCAAAAEDAQCVLCPMPGGALKPVLKERRSNKERSTRSEWSHVSCAWFVPAVTFGDHVRLSPVIGVQRIEKARWKLTCTLCKQKNVGACIQCAEPTCTTAMHVTCAQSAQLYMSMTDEGNDVQLRVYCRRHAPKDRPPNFSVCPELAATRQLLAQVMRGSRSRHSASNHAVARADARVATGDGGKGKASDTHTPQAIDGSELTQGQSEGGLLSTAPTPVCAHGALDGAHQVATDPFARIAPGTCAVCLLQADVDEAGALLCCDSCRVHVHQHCWGGAAGDGGGGWRCARCLRATEHDAAGPTAVQCSLCPAQGGCLKKTLSGDWVHVQCALWIPELRFQTPELLDGISSTGKIPKERRLLTCQVCKLPTASDAAPAKKARRGGGSPGLAAGRVASTGACIQCCKGGCFAAFHVTCAQLAGYHMVMLSGGDQQDEVPPLTPFCPKHRPRFIWKAHYVDSLKFLTIQDLLPFSLVLAKDDALAIIRDAVKGVQHGGHASTLELPEEIADGIYLHWLSKRQRRGHFLSRHHVVALQDLVAFLPGELEQNKHKDPFYIKRTDATPAVTNKRKRPRLSAPRKLSSSSAKRVSGESGKDAEPSAC